MRDRFFPRVARAYSENMKPSLRPLSHGAEKSTRGLTETPTSRLSTDMRTQDVITEKLTRAFAPQSLRVEDESHQHEGHAGHRPGGETHFRVYIVSEAFRGKNRLAMHRMINEALTAELAGSVHALAIHAAAPGEGTA
jgi:BolA protein